MVATYQEFRIFLSSPGDVPEEREVARNVIEKVGRTCKEPLRLFFDTLRWEDITPTGATEESIQAQINERIRKCHVFVLILNKRFGTVEPGFKKSNTEREVDVALDLKKANRKIKFLAYFRGLPENVDQGDQERRLRDLRAKLVEKGILYAEYKNASDFQDKFTHHLYDTALRFHHSSTKVKALSRFWQLGTPERYTSRNLAVVYPVLSFAHMKPIDPEDFWLKRIVPTIQYEDMRAVDKIDKTLRLIGVRQAGFFSVDNAPADINFMNRVWICQARNRLAQKYYEKHRAKANFCFRYPKSASEAKLYWRYNSDVDDFIEVRSPLNKYLTEQRKVMNIKGPWRKELGMIVAKDYGILARMRNETDEVPMRDGFIYDYFVAGIRGLGTWGAAHFIDRNYHLFMEYPEHDDFQLLLEVTYRNNRIFDVRDVSAETEHYFKQQRNLNFVRKVLEDEEPYEPD